MKITNLSEKAMLVKLTTRRVNLTRRDAIAEQVIQQQLDDISLTVNSKLFRDKTNPVNQIVQAAGRVYVYHRTHTHPFVDRGDRVLPNALYDEYTGGMRALINAVDNLMAKHIPNYDAYVLQDIAYRSTNKTNSRAQVSDYPTAEEFERGMGFDFRFKPMPDRRHFLYDISDEDLENFEMSIRDTTSMAVNNTVEKMLVPLKHLADALAHPIGATDPVSGGRLGIFRDSAIENVIEGVQLAKKLAIDPPPELVNLTKELETAITHCDEHANWLRESPINRTEAATKLAHIASQMAAFMGVAA